MQVFGIGNCKTIDQFVDMQMSALRGRDQTFESVYEIMFSMRDNIMFETTDGNKIFKTTYGEVYDRISVISSLIKNRFSYCDHGTVIGIYMDNSIEWIEIFWSLLKAGFVPLIINKRLDIERLETLLKSNSVKAVITDSREFSVETVHFEEIINSSCERIESNWEDEIILMSSGSSDDVKLCYYNGATICEQIYNSADIVRKSDLIKAHYEGYIKQLTFLPFYHVFGLVACYMWFAFFGRTFVLLKNISGETILNTVRKHKVTHIFAVPMLWEKIRKSATKIMEQRRPQLVDKFKKGLKISNALQSKFSSVGRAFAKKAFKEVRDNLFGDSVQFLITGGGAVTTKTLQFFNGIGYRLANGYGMTEIGIASVELGNSSKVLNSGSVGRAFGSVQYRINDKGLLEVRSKSIAKKIVTRGETVLYTGNDWFETGDSAKIQNGRLYIMGRSDDLIVSSAGENISPSTIEDRISIPDTSVCMLGLERKGKIKATLIIGVSKYFSKQKIASIKEELFNIIKQNGYTSLIDDVCFTYDPIMTENEFKLNRNNIRKRIVSGDLKLIYPEHFENEEHEENINEELREKIINMFSDVLEKEILPSQCSQNFFFELGGSSLAYFQLIENIKAEFNVPFPIVEEQSIATVNDFCIYLQDRI
ncbi:MAG: AMP-binding protein [Clostridia bacterium]|nr:AMP-binding protein [Clostridia bacterium]